MRAFAIVSAAVLAAQLFGVAGAAQAEEICLFGGPDAAADLACGQAYVAPARPAPAFSGAADSYIAGGQAVRANGAAESRILGGGRVQAAMPALPSNYAPPPAGPQTWPAPDAYGYAPDAAYYYDAQAALPPPPPSLDSYIAVDGAGPAPGTYAYAYESADGGAFAWRYDTPQGPAWAYAYETPEGWAYAYAYDTGAAGAPPPMIEAYSPAYAQPYVEHDSYGGFHTDWRYMEETRLYGASYPRQLYLVETYYRESAWETVSVLPGRTFIGCGACGGYGHGGGYGYPAPAPRPGFVVAGGGGAVSGGFAGSGGFLVANAGARGGSSASASNNFAVSNTASMSAQNMATARGNQSVVAGAPFAPPPGAPPAPWGPAPQGMGPGNVASSSAFAGANAASSARR